MLICVSLMIADMELAVSQHCQCGPRAQAVRIQDEGRVHAVQARAGGRGWGGAECPRQRGADTILGN